MDDGQTDRLMDWMGRKMDRWMDGCHADDDGCIDGWMEDLSLEYCVVFQFLLDVKCRWFRR